MASLEKLTADIFFFFFTTSPPGPQDVRVIIEYNGKNFPYLFRHPPESLDKFKEQVRERLKLPIAPEIQFKEGNSYLELDDIAYLPAAVKTLKVSLSQESWWSWPVALEKGWVTKGDDTTQYHYLQIVEGGSVKDQPLYEKFKSVAEFHHIDLAKVKK